MNERENPNKFSTLEKTWDEFCKAYEGVKPGDAKLMALWDVSEQIFTQKGYKKSLSELENENLKKGGDRQALMTEAVLNMALINNRINSRSSEFSGYYEEMIRAKKWLKKLANERCLEYSQPFEKSSYEAANYALAFAQTKAINPVSPKPFLRRIQ